MKLAETKYDKKETGSLRGELVRLASPEAVLRAHTQP